MAGVTLGFLKFVLGFDTVAFKKGMTAAERELVVMQKNFAKVGKGLTNLGRSMSLAITTPVLGIGAAALKMAADFETSMNDVAISTKATAAELATMKNLALDIGKSTTKSASEAASAMDILAKAGMSTTDIIKGGAKATVALAEASGSELEPAAAAVTDAMKQFDLSTADLPFVINQITGAVNESKFAFDDFTLGMGQAGGIAASSGVEFEEFAAALAATSSQFTSGSDAGTSFKTFIQRLTPDTKPAIAAMQSVGFSAYDAAGNMKPLAVIAQDLQDKFGKMSEQDRTAIFEKMFGTDAIRTAIGLMKAGAKGVEEMQAKIAATDASAQAAQRMKGLNAELEKLRGSFETLAIKLADSGILTAVTNFVAGVGTLIDKFAELDVTTRNWILSAVAVVAAIGPILAILGPLVTVISKIGPAVGFLVKTFLLFRDAMLAVRIAAVALAPIMGSIGLPLIALTAAVTGIYLAWKNWDKIWPIIKELYAVVKTWIADKLGKLWDDLKADIDAATGWFRDMYNAVVGGSYVPDMVAGIGAEIAKLDAVLVKPVQAATGKAGEAFRDLQQKAADLLRELFPEAAAINEYQAKLKFIADHYRTMGLSADQAAEATKRLTDQFNALPDEAPGWWEGVSSNPEFFEGTGVFAPIDIGSGDVIDDIRKANEDSLEKITEATRDKTAEMATYWGQMASDAVYYMRDMVKAFKGGDILGGIQALLDTILSVVQALGRVGVFGGGGGAKSASGWASGARSGFGGFRALGGPVVPGKTYMVGENGPEWFSSKKRGYIHPTGKDAEPQRVVVIPSPYFDVVVDHRAANVAAPMAGRAAIVGVTGSEVRANRRARRNLLAA